MARTGATKHIKNSTVVYIVRVITISLQCGFGNGFYVALPPAPVLSWTGVVTVGLEFIIPPALPVFLKPDGRSRESRYRINPRSTLDRKSTRLNSSHVATSYAVF